MAAAGGESFQRLVGQEAGWFPHSDKSDVFFTDSVQETGSEEGLHRHARHKKAKHPESEASPTRARSVVRGRSHTVKLPSDQKQGSAVNRVAPPLFNAKTKLKIKKNISVTRNMENDRKIHLV